jgi:hypothetical protein
MMLAGLVVLASMGGCSALSATSPELRSTQPSAPASSSATPAKPQSSIASQLGSSTFAATTATIGNDGCGPSDLAPFDNEPPATRVQFGYGLPVVILEAGTAANEASARAAFPNFIDPGFVPPDLPLQLVLVLPRDTSVSYVETFYSAQPIAAEETNVDFYSQRGLIISQTSTQGQTAAMVEATIGEQAFGEHARIVKVGTYDAAIIHDVAPDAVRPYHLYWSDGTRDIEIGATTTPAEAVDVARSMYCGQ